MCRPWVALAVLLLPAAGMAAEPAPAVADKLAADALKAWGVPGAAVVVVRGDDTLVLKGYGRRVAGKPEPVTPDTVFPLASCSKAFTTALIALLVDDEVMGWDDPVRKHLPDFKLSDPNADALLTVRDLLCHRCGLGGHDFLWYRAPWGLDETLRRATRLPLSYPFRAGFQYSSIPFLAAGRAAEKRTGRAWEKLVRTRLCDPLGMTGVTFTTTAIPKGADRAGGHRAGKDGTPRPTPWYEMPEPNPSGSVNATARDLAAWLKFHLADGVGPDGVRIASVRNLTETKTPHNPIRLEGSAKAFNPDTVQLSYGLAWLVCDHRGKKVVTHGGLIDGFRVQITLLPDENLGFAVLANLHDTRMPAALVNSLIDVYAGLPAKDWNGLFLKAVADEAAARKAALAARDRARNPDAGPTLPAAGYPGEYTHPAYGAATVAADGGKLTLTWGNFTCPLVHFEGDTFRITDGQFADDLVSFVVGNGKAKTVRFDGQEFRRNP